jgi:hypothetical protein
MKIPGQFSAQINTYYDKLVAQGYVAEVKVNNEGHNLTADIVGPGGVKAWFDQY